MRAITCLLALAIAFGACGGNPQAVTMFRVGPDGRPEMNTRKDVVVDRQSALWSAGWGYAWDCKYETPQTIYGGETKQYQLINNSTNGHCTGWGLGGSSVMGIGFNEWVWAGTSTTLNAMRPSSFRTKISDSNGGTHHGDNKMYLNNVLGDGCAGLTSPVGSACFVQIAPSTEFSGNFHYDARPGSFDFVRRCAAPGQPGFECS